MCRHALAYDCLYAKKCVHLYMHLNNVKLKSAASLMGNCMSCY